MEEAHRKNRKGELYSRADAAFPCKNLPCSQPGQQPAGRNRLLRRFEPCFDGDEVEAAQTAMRVASDFFIYPERASFSLIAASSARAKTTADLGSRWEPSTDRISSTG